MTPLLDFNRDWSFAKADVEWPDDFIAADPVTESVILPHTWNADDMVVGCTEPYIGPGWYRKEFRTPELETGQRVVLLFEGAANCFKVWVNNGYAGGRNGGFLPTQVDITALLDAGENTILVRVDNSYELLAAMPRNIDWNRYGGLTRPVWLQLKEHAFLDNPGVEIETPEVSAEAAQTSVKTHIQEAQLEGAALGLRHTLTDPNGQTISETVVDMESQYGRKNTVTVELPVVEKPQLWSDTRPLLYSLRTELIEDGRIIDTQTDRVGYRFFRFDPNDGFTLNGVPTKLRGANIHIFFPGLGSALPERFYRADMGLMKEMGCNYMRASHYPRPKACLDACDELGILVLEEQPYWHGSVRAANGERAVDNAPRLISDMVRHHRNHPSIIAWNTVNEVMLAPAYKPGVGHLEPNDPRRAAWSINPKEYPYIRRHLQKMVDAFKESDSSRPVTMVVGGGWQKNDDAGLTSLPDIVAYNGGALNFVENFVGPGTGKTYPFRPDYYREVYPRRIHMMSEGVLNDICFERGDWQQEERAWRNNARYWDAFYERQWFCGGSMWCFTDYSANGLIRLHGAVDRYRLPKDLFCFYQAMWSEKPFVHILGHWNFIEGEKREVVVFTNLNSIELMLNGRSLGPGFSCSEAYPYIPHAPRVWSDIPFEPGTLVATGRAADGEYRDQRVTAGAAAKIGVTALCEEIAADGRDISYVDVVVCDAAGLRCYTEKSDVMISVSGAATLAGPARRATAAGLLRFAIRSNGQPGEVIVKVSAPQLAPGTATIKSAQFRSDQGKTRSRSE